MACPWGGSGTGGRCVESPKSCDFKLWTSYIRYSSVLLVFGFSSAFRL